MFRCLRRRCSVGRCLIFVTGVALGFLILVGMQFWTHDYNSERASHQETNTDDDMEHSSYRRWLHNEEHVRQVFEPLFETDVKVTEAQYLFDRIFIHCVVLSSNRRQARAVVGTWGRHCNSLDFVADYQDKFVPVTINLPTEDRHYLCRITREVSTTRLKEDTSGWLFLARDTTFAVVENLRRFVAPLNSTDIHYLGHAVRKTRFGLPIVVNAVSGGIVLSKGAVLQLAYTFGADCSSREDDLLEDMVADGLKASGVSPRDTRDYLGRARFIARPLHELLRPGGISPYDSFLKQTVFSSPAGSMCCSPTAISLAGVDALEMHLWEFTVFRCGVGSVISKHRGDGGAPLRDSFVPPVSIEGDQPPVLPRAPTEL